ncbi:hypothetical protein ACWGKW_23030 [Streptomyces sp. NPDC054766]
MAESHNGLKTGLGSVRRCLALASWAATHDDIERSALDNGSEPASSAETPD